MASMSSSESQTVSMLGETRAVLCGDSTETESEITLDKLFTLVKSMGSSLNERFTELNTNFETKISSIEASLQKLESVCDKVAGLTSRVDAIENEISQMNKTSAEFQQNLVGISGVFDTVKSETDETSKSVQNLQSEIRKMTESFTQLKAKTEIEMSRLIEKNEETTGNLIDMRCRQMKMNLVFTGIKEYRGEDTDDVLRTFFANELDIDPYLELGNVHRFGKSYPGRPRPIVAKFIYQRELDYVLSAARNLAGKPFRINRQFPPEVEQARRSLYPVMKELRDKGERVKLVRDILYVNGEPYEPYDASEIEMPGANTSPKSYASVVSPAPIPPVRHKRRRVGSTPEATRR